VRLGLHAAAVAASVVLGVGTTATWASTWGPTLAAGSTGEAKGATLPSAPGGVTAVCSSATSNTVVVSWTAVTGAASYAVYQATSAATGPYSVAASGVTGTSWTSGGLSSGNYWFEVSTYEGTNWQSALSAVTMESTIVKSGVTKTCTQP
jgi:hypothetical protein